MRKLFLAICFSFCLAPFYAKAEVRGMSSMQEAKSSVSAEEKMQASQDLIEERAYYRSMTEEQMLDYLKERLFHVVTNELDVGDGLGGDGAVNIQKSQLQLEREAQEKKSIFEKIYENAMNNLIDTSKPKPAAQLYTEEVNGANLRPSAADNADKLTQLENAQRQAWLNSNINMIEAELPPFQEKTLLPAMEHIPYLFSRIEILPDSLVKVTDTIVVVANGEKIKDNIMRAFPKYVFDREGKRQKTEFNLLGVLVNGRPIDYKLSDRNNYVFMEPVQPMKLAPGVYEYQFDYTVDNQLFSYDEFDEFYWNLTGSVWNLVISRAGASLILPPNTKTLGQISLSGYNGYWRDDTVTITQEQDNVLGFVSQTPLFIGQAMEIIVSLPKGYVSEISWSKRFLRFINAYGDILFSALGFVAILLSYIVSWNYIRSSRYVSSKSVLKNPILLRYLKSGNIDKKSFGVFLLELFRKNIIDIEENDDNILLVKKTDNLSSLSANERKAVNALFASGESILNINSYSTLKIKRAWEFVKKDALKKIRLLTFKLNCGYLLFSIGMLIVAEAAIALLNYDFAYNFTFLILADLIFVFCLWLFQKKFAVKWKNVTAKTFAVFLAAANMFILLAIINLTAVLFIMAILIVISCFTKLYTQRTGLLSVYVKEAENFAALLQKKTDALSLGRDFLNNQAAIFALDCETLYQPIENNKAFYKLDLIEKLVAKI